jgi:tRNA threonylcarbamoyladenosine biosynthesis protein TsaE
MDKEKTYVAETEFDLISIAEQILKDGHFSPIFCLSGDLGAGKTRLIKSFGKLLHVEDEISSPTYSIINEYNSSQGTVYHMDLYRLDNIESAQDIGLEEYLHSKRPVFIEWPEIADDILPICNRIKIDVIDDSTRKIVHLYQ